MLTFFLKWILIALIALTAFSGATVLWALYELNLGSCAAACETVQTLNAYLYVGLIGVCGFGCSALAAFIIKRNFER